jgi:hypothetical protein
MAQLFANNASTTLANGITNSATSLVVASATGFPATISPDYFYATLSNAANTLWEVVKVTGVSGTTFTVVRAQDGTTGLAWSSGDVFEMRPVAQGLRDILSVSNINIDGGKASSVYGGAAAINCGGAT